MTHEVLLLVRIREALLETQALHEMTHRIATGEMDGGSTRKCQAILAEHAHLVTDVDRAISDALFAKRVPA